MLEHEETTQSCRTGRLASAAPYEFRIPPPLGKGGGHAIQQAPNFNTGWGAGHGAKADWPRCPMESHLACADRSDVSNMHADLTRRWFYTSGPLCVLFCSPLSTTFQNTRQMLSWLRASTCPCLPAWTRQRRGPFISTAAGEPPAPPLAASFPLPFPLAPFVLLPLRQRLGDSTGC